MELSRRSFVKLVGGGSAGALVMPLSPVASLIGARGTEARSPSLVPNVIRLDSNENPNGPGQLALNAIRGAFGNANRYPDAYGSDLRAAIAKANGVSVENVVIGCGSTEILHMAVHAFTSPTRALVTASPTFEEPAAYAQTLGAPVRTVRVDDRLRLDLATMATKAEGAGLIFVCNPNNPTASLHSSATINDFVRRVRRGASPPAVLLDEAYFEYVDDPSYATGIPLALETPGVIVSRTFSKIFGMAGLRVGYAIARPETIEKLRPHALPSAVSALAGAAAIAAISSTTRREHVEAERKANREAREFTRRALEGMKYRVMPTHTNFMMVDIRRDSAAFQQECRRQDVFVGRPFPPLNNLARISIGTMDEMRRAVDVFKRVLA
jgi:histidinol-phosphate aminotransferase